MRVLTWEEWFRCDFRGASGEEERRGEEGGKARAALKGRVLDKMLEWNCLMMGYC